MALFAKKMLGIDVGVAAIKMVEISRWGKTYRLENYGEMQLDLLPADLLPHENLTLPPRNFVAAAMRAIITAARIESRQAVFALPDFATFCASFTLPPMPSKEIADAVRYNAHKYLASPVTDVTLDWTVVPTAAKGLNIFLTAVPNQLINDYRFIAQKAGLDLRAVESEAFGALRAVSLKNRGSAACIIDIGRHDVTFSLADQGMLRKSYSLNFDGEAFRSAFMAPPAAPAVLSVENTAAKPAVGIMPIPQAARPMVELIVQEAKSIFIEVLPSGKVQPKEIYLVGGFAKLPGLRDYLSDSLRTPVSLPNCFSDIRHPAKLNQALEDMSPRFAAAVGVALGALA